MPKFCQHLRSFLSKNDWIKEYKIFKVSDVFQKGSTSFHSNRHQHSLTVSLLTMTITIFKSQCYFRGERVCFDKISSSHYKIESFYMFTRVISTNLKAEG